MLIYRLGVLLAVGGVAVFSHAEDRPYDGYLIKYRENLTALGLSQSISKGKLTFKRYLRTGPMAQKSQMGLICAASSLPRGTALAQLRKDPSIEWVEPNYIVSGQSVSNDPFFLNGNLWGMYGNLSTPANQYGSQAAEAWANGYVGDSTIHIAILDDGVQVEHPDLAANIWTNTEDPVEDPPVDDDMNGYPNDFNGWNFVGSEAQETGNVYFPGDTHATLMAGVIGATGGNALGVAGINWNCKMISVRSLANGSGTILDIVEGMDYCTDLKTSKGIKLVAINAAFGGTTYSRFLHDAVIRAAKADILVVAAAGNLGTDNDSEPFYPASLNSMQGTVGETAASYENVISVTAIDSTGNLASFSSGSSSYGLTSVDIGAPGKAIVSTYPENQYAEAEGTSMAVAHVTGAIALYASTHPNATAEQIRSAILGAAAPTPSLQGITVTGGRLDLSSVISPSIASIQGRHIFYNQSSFDGNNAAANASDDNAIATNKTALLPGNTATFANYTSYSRGINGIMIDLADAIDSSSITASDFEFNVGNDVNISSWAAAATPSSVTIRAGAGVNGSDRVTIIWANNAIQKRWLKITVKANSRTGLPVNDVFFFGNAIAETGNSVSDARVTSTDVARIRNNLQVNTPAHRGNLYDFNRDGRVTSTDVAIARNNLAVNDALRLLSIPSN